MSNDYKSPDYYPNELFDPQWDRQGDITTLSLKGSTINQASSTAALIYRINHKTKDVTILFDGQELSPQEAWNTGITIDNDAIVLDNKGNTIRLEGGKTLTFTAKGDGNWIKFKPDGNYTFYQPAATVEVQPSGAYASVRKDGLKAYGIDFNQPGSLEYRFSAYNGASSKVFDISRRNPAGASHPWTDLYQVRGDGRVRYLHADMNGDKIPDAVRIVCQQELSKLYGVTLETKENTIIEATDGATRKGTIVLGPDALKAEASFLRDFHAQIRAVTADFPNIPPGPAVNDSCLLHPKQAQAMGIRQ